MNHTGKTTAVVPMLPSRVIKTWASWLTNVWCAASFKRKCATPPVRCQPEPVSCPTFRHRGDVYWYGGYVTQPSPFLRLPARKNSSATSDKELKNWVCENRPQGAGPKFRPILGCVVSKITSFERRSTPHLLRQFCHHKNSTIVSCNNIAL